MMDNKNIPAVDQSWSEAEKMLDKHFRKKRMIVLFFSIVIPAFIVGLTFIINHSKKNQEKNIVTSVQSEVSSSKEIVNSTAKIINEKPEISKSLKSDISSIASNKSTNTQNNIIPQTSGTETKNTLSTPDNSGKKRNNEGILLSNSGKETSVKNSSVVKNNSGYITDERLSITNNNSYLNNTNSESISFMNPVYAQLELNNGQNSLIEKTNLSPDKNHGYAKIGWEATICGGAHYVQKALSVSNDWNNYLQHRENEEDPIVAPFIGMSVSANINSLSMSMGIEYSVYGEKTNYYPYSNQLTFIDNSNWQTYLRSIVDTDTAYVTGNQYFLQTTYLRLDSSMVTDRDTIEEYKYDQHIAETNGTNRIYYVELPVEVSYCLSKGKLGFGLSGGIAPAMRVQEKGYYIRTDGRGVESLSEIESLRTFIFNARMSVDLYYRVADRMKLVLRPQFRTNLNSIFKDDYGVNQKYYSTGVLFGVSYMLN